MKHYEPSMDVRLSKDIDIKNIFFSCFTHVEIPYTSRFFLYDCHLLVNVIMPCSCILYMPVILFLKKSKNWHFERNSQAENNTSTLNNCSVETRSFVFDHIKLPILFLFCLRSKARRRILL